MGPSAIDHLVNYDNSGIWARHNRRLLEYGTAVAVVGGSLLLGDQNKLGDTFWHSLDSVAASSAIAQLGKWTFQRERPSQSTNPNQ